jgi:hypothetical protein
MFAAGVLLLCLAQEDPFANIQPAPAGPVTAVHQPSRWRSFFSENFGFRKEVMSQFAKGERYSSRQSVGFEVLKKFSTETRTVASFSFQGRFVRRDGFNAVQNDREGMMRPGSFFEYHNFFADFYDVLHPLLPGEKKQKMVGKLNFRAGRFYVPFGLNLQTDTHGPVLQLSNDRNFGFERDWYTGFWGSLNRHVNYDAYYLVGSGYDLAFRGQRGMGALRLSLGNQYASRYGLEGGVSVLSGDRIPMGAHHAVETRRHGVDLRWRRSVPKGLVTLTHESSRGRDARQDVGMQLHQAEYLHSSRRWSTAVQFRRFTSGGKPDALLLTDVTWYFRNDVSNSNLHWLKLVVDRRLIALQYYFYR